jgi:hypothetical protein
MSVGYFDGLASKSFKQVDDRWVFYAYGMLGRGVVLPDEERHARLRRFVTWHLRIAAPVLVLVGLTMGWAFAALPGAISVLWYAIAIRRQTRGLPLVER